MKTRFRLTRAIREAEEEESGFTLIELLIVVLILGILAAIVVFALGTFASTSATAACNTDAKSVETAVGAYQTANGNFPAGSTTLSSLVGAAAGGPYLRTAPNSKYYGFTLGASGVVNVYLKTGDPGTAYSPSGTTAKLGTGTANAQNYDTMTWNGAHNSPPSSYTNICSGA